MPRGDTSAFLDGYRWEKRPLIVLAPREDAPLARAQRLALDRKTREFMSRDMVWIEVLGDDVLVNGARLPAVRAADIRHRYGISRIDACVLLVGKDGGLKLRRTEAISAGELFATIDAMPMRQREARTGNEARGWR